MAESADQEPLDLRGKSTAWFHGHLKRHPRLRGTLISAFSATQELAGRMTTRHDRTLLGEADPHKWIDEWRSSGDTAPAWIKDVLAAEKVTPGLPLGLHGQVDSEYTEIGSVEIPQPFVAEIPSGHLLGEHGAVATPDGYVIERASRPVGPLNEHLSGIHVGRTSPENLRKDWGRRATHAGKAAVLSAYVGRGYFHWLFDVLPRLALLQAADVDVESVDAFVVPSYFAGYQIESLARFGIGRDRIVSSFSHRHVVADQLIVPSLARETGLTPRWVCDFLRDTYRPIQPRGIGRPPRRVYIVRKSTDHGLLSNESLLTRRLSNLGFVALAMEDYRLEEKAWLLQDAEVMVGASGAGLTNAVFCNPGAVVVELRVQSYPIMDAWDIANRLDLRYYDVLPPGYERVEDMSARLSGEVSGDEVEATLALAGIVS